MKKKKNFEGKKNFERFILKIKTVKVARWQCADRCSAEDIDDKVLLPKPRRANAFGSFLEKNKASKTNDLSIFFFSRKEAKAFVPLRGRLVERYLARSGKTGFGAFPSG
jgi:hypothetical protein